MHIKLRWLCPSQCAGAAEVGTDLVQRGEIWHVTVHAHIDLLAIELRSLIGMLPSPAYQSAFLLRSPVLKCDGKLGANARSFQALRMK
jgi:hypothetical protein